MTITAPELAPTVHLRQMTDDIEDSITQAGSTDFPRDDLLLIIAGHLDRIATALEQTAPDSPDEAA